MKALDRSILFGLIFTGIVIFGNFDSPLLDFGVKALVLLIPLVILSVEHSRIKKLGQNRKLQETYDRLLRLLKRLSLFGSLILATFYAIAFFVPNGFAIVLWAILGAIAIGLIIGLTHFVKQVYYWNMEGRPDPYSYRKRSQPTLHAPADYQLADSSSEDDEWQAKDDIVTFEHFDNRPSRRAFKVSKKQVIILNYRIIRRIGIIVAGTGVVTGLFFLLRYLNSAFAIRISTMVFAISSLIITLGIFIVIRKILRITPKIFIDEIKSLSIVTPVCCLGTPLFGESLLEAMQLSDGQKLFVFGLSYSCAIAFGIGLFCYYTANSLEMENKGMMVQRAGELTNDEGRLFYRNIKIGRRLYDGAFLLIFCGFGIMLFSLMKITSFAFKFA